MANLRARLMSTSRVVLCSLAAAGMILLQGSAADAKQLTFGYVPASLEYPYNVATAQGFKEAAEAAGVKAVVLDPRGSVEKQGNSIDDLISQKVDAVGFLPLDSAVAESFVDKLNAANIPVVAIALQVGDSTKRQLTDPYPGLSALVATDNYKAG